MWSDVFHAVFAPGFFQNGSVRQALLLGSATAILSGMVGVFAVLRGQSFAGHALGDFGATGASGAFLLGAPAIWGFLTVGLLGGTAMDVLGRRPRERDVATGITLTFILGLGALFLYFDTTHSNTTGAPMTILFGSIFLIDPALVPITLSLAILTLMLLFVLYRPLLLSSLSPDLARARGVPVRVVSILFMSALAMTVEQAAILIGALLSTALLIGPAATAIRLVKRPGQAMTVAALVGLLATWLGILCAYDSYNWPPLHRGWPVSFFVAALLLLFYLAASAGATSISRVRIRRNPYRHFPQTWKKVASPRERGDA
ncbi:metal ABC transporter permease [Alicyclobacillus sp. SP_1]|uniref:metal ABC transporter permease n=1 Tax=Alicyclobacillus sp. SP_1 TaxID=2942475 RepID=UPI002158517F|nr:metal ABC transporter permease [Alicyclobacillus sp. SP_1]